MPEDKLLFNSVIKGYKLDQDKAIHPRETYDRALSAFKKAFPDRPLYLKNISQQSGIHVFDVNDGFLNTHGKGATEDQARASAIMEFMERFSWREFDYKNAAGYTLASFNDMAAQYDMGDIARAFELYYSQEKESLGDLLKTIPLHWIRGYSLTAENWTWYPINYNNLYQISNGLSAGNTREEAILQGLCEIIERHNVTGFLLKPHTTNARLIRLESIDNEYIQDILKLYKARNIDLYALDISRDIPVATVLVYARDNQPILENVRRGYGYGCHTDPVKAVIRAMTEYSQMREGVVKNANKNYDAFDFKTGNWQFILNLDIEKVIAGASTVAVTDLPLIANDDIKVELERVLYILKSLKAETIYIDKTHPLLGIPACRVFAPGLYPGTIIGTVMYENEYVLIANLLLQSGQRDRAQEFFLQNFDKIKMKYKPIVEVIADSYAKIAGSTRIIHNSIKAAFRMIESDLILSTVTPETMPMDSLCKSDYKDVIRINSASPLAHMKMDWLTKYGDKL